MNLESMSGSIIDKTKSVKEKTVDKLNNIWTKKIWSKYNFQHTQTI